MTQEIMKELETTKNIMQIANKALMGNTSENFRNLMTEKEKVIWINGYLTAFIDSEKNKKGNNK
jgi:hypothetical protein